MAEWKEARDVHNKHLSSQLEPPLFPPLQEQVTLFPLAVHVADCSESPQNSLQSSSSSFSQADLEVKNDGTGPAGWLDSADKA